MNNEEKNQELKQLIENLSIPPEQAQQMLHDIQQGDTLLDKYAQPFIPQPVADNVTRALQHALVKQKSRRIRKMIYHRIAAALVIIALASAAIVYWQNYNSTATTASNQNKTIATNINNNNIKTKAVATNITNTSNSSNKTIASNNSSNNKTYNVSNKTIHMTLDEADILELALIAEQQQNESNIDDMVLTEVLSSWDSSQPQNNSSRKESSYETTNNYFTGLNSHCRYA